MQTACSACPAGTFKAAAGDLACSPCQSGSYSPAAGSTSCISCASGSTSPEGSSADSACQPSKSSEAAGGSRVQLQVIMPYTRESFTEARQDKFKAAIARQASVGCECEVGKQDVRITGIVEQTVTPGARRRLHSTQIAVDLSIAMPNVASGKLLVESEQLSLEQLNAELAKEGLEPIAEISSRPKLVATGEDADSSGSRTVTIVVVVGVTLLMLGCTVVLWRNKQLLRNKVVADTEGHSAESNAQDAEEAGVEPFSADGGAQVSSTPSLPTPAPPTPVRRLSSRLSKMFSIPARHRMVWSGDDASGQQVYLALAFSVRVCASVQDV